ncbi:Uncharacterised protein [Mycobacteroides abscessus subsp. bolletii]|uniref:DUF2971 domain-containing protein n=1 Tax=Mycobacteroides abscessus TaxID=36809 RepID=UPI00092877B3|nr:DUF2971 domain-containing protein [Mycobacteroides abscessus]SHP16118.1 Uncharacterised protein [Mycobacteroides abscessus subsp. bolletii]SHR30973.1 Uncharacterised protein [Mycobacteroides abscessus subsp. bolletii]SHR83184.1 Uncharacterised protein [Mycobacteroides abscessus subsp. bolletii]SHS42821.1 Uncharacterised protein [Mycobacteroides abscessus subsp. bolletii]SHX31290.1 Uncharacterised protein [Mycobacteroides abscessus subsp. bolletii]
MDDDPSGSAKFAAQASTDDQPIPDLYHYTSAEGLYGILNNQQLWLTHAGYLNDTEEFIYGLRVIMEEMRDYRAEINSRISSGESGLNELSGYIDGALNAFDFTNLLNSNNALSDGMSTDEKILLVSTFQDRITPFVSCLSTERDQLSQWRGYARGGYAIRFDTEALRSTMCLLDRDGNRIESGSNLRMAKVLYAAEDFRGEVRDVVRSTINSLPELTKSFHHLYVANSFGIDRINKLVNSMLSQGSLLKNRKFHEESEYRITVNCLETFVTPSALGFTPRAAISFDSSAVKEVIVGPSEFAVVRRLSVQRYLHSSGHGYVHVTASPSEIPYRET